MFFTWGHENWGMLETKSEKYYLTKIFTVSFTMKIYIAEIIQQTIIYKKQKS